MAVKLYDVVGVGNPFYDRILHVDDETFAETGLVKGVPDFSDDLAKVNRTWEKCLKGREHNQWSLGGSGTNVIKALAHFGHRCALYGMIGSKPDSLEVDARGATVLDRLKQLEITSLLGQGKDVTGFVNCFATEGERTMQAYLGAAGEITEDIYVPEAFSAVKLVHLEGYSSLYKKLMVRGITHAKNAGAQVSLDLAGTNIITFQKEKFEQNVPRVDYLFGNAEEMQVYTGHKYEQKERIGSPLDPLKDIVENFDQNQCVVATDGARGCWVKPAWQPDAFHSPAQRVAGIVDLIAAGDLFCSGFLDGVLRGQGPEKCARKGHVCASMIIQNEGAELPKGDWKSLRAYMERA